MYFLLIFEPQIVVYFKIYNFEKYNLIPEIYNFVKIYNNFYELYNSPTYNIFCKLYMFISVTYNTFRKLYMFNMYKNNIQLRKGNSGVIARYIPMLSFFC